MTRALGSSITGPIRNASEYLVSDGPRSLELVKSIGSHFDPIEDYDAGPWWHGDMKLPEWPLVYQHKTEASRFATMMWSGTEDLVQGCFVFSGKDHTWEEMHIDLLFQPGYRNGLQLAVWADDFLADTDDYGSVSVFGTSEYYGLMNEALVYFAAGAHCIAQRDTRSVITAGVEGLLYDDRRKNLIQHIRPDELPAWLTAEQRAEAERAA